MSSSAALLGFLTVLAESPGTRVVVAENGRIVFGEAANVDTIDTGKANVRELTSLRSGDSAEWPTTTLAKAGNVAIVHPREPPWYHVNAQMNNKASAPAPLIWKSQAVATAIFAKIGIRLTWRFDGRRPASKMVRSCGGEAPASTLALEIVPQAPANLAHTALAMSIPLADSFGHIAIFYERVVPVLREHQSHQAAILGYVLAHEIAHVLQAVASHSETGIMRARWTENEFSQMGIGVLTFTDEDIELIQRRLECVASTSCNNTLRSQSEPRARCVTFSPEAVMVGNRNAQPVVFGGR